MFEEFLEVLPQYLAPCSFLRKFLKTLLLKVQNNGMGTKISRYVLNLLLVWGKNVAKMFGQICKFYCSPNVNYVSRAVLK